MSDLRTQPHDLQLLGPSTVGAYLQLNFQIPGFHCGGVGPTCSFGALTWVGVHVLRQITDFFFSKIAQIELARLQCEFESTRRLVGSN